MNKSTIDIKYSDVTFVIQGGVTITDGENVTQKCIDSIRRFYPSSKVILSTWPDKQLLSSVRNAEILINTDPGPIATRNKYLKNYNRMVVSTTNGIRHAKTIYVAKIRSDFWFEKYFPLIDYIQCTSKCHSDFECQLHSRILMCMYKGHYDLFPYFISDWFHFGNREDMLKMWSGNLILDSELIKGKTNKHSLLQEPFVACDVVDELDYPFHSEQRLALDFLNAIGYKKTPLTNLFGFKDLLQGYIVLGKVLNVIPRADVGLLSRKHIVTSNIFDTLPWSMAIRSSKNPLYKLILFLYLLVRYLRVLISRMKLRLKGM